jgi:23S rRNA (uracil1939-C5)-methyltransferase
VSPFELEIHDLSHDARGIGRIGEKIAFIDGALPGELVRGDHLHSGQSFDHGRATEILRRSPERVSPKCIHFGGCAGCSLQHFSQNGQVHYKQNMLLQDLKKFGRTEPERILPPLIDQAFGYRRKARLSVKDVAKKGKVLVGFRELDGRFVADLTRCETLHPKVGDRIDDLARMIESLQARRNIAQIELTIADNACALVFRNLIELVSADREKLIAFGEKFDFQIWLQPKGVDSIFPLNDASAGLHYRIDAFDLTIHYQPLDFTQVNFGLNQKMLVQAMDLLAPKADERILDLFCGLGNFTLPIARSGATVMGVEGDAGLIRRARENAERNGLNDRVDYAVADLFADQRDSGWAKTAFDKMLLDPPRAGAQELLQYLPHDSVQRIVYVSCNPATLARDSEILVHRAGFKLKAAGVMDMFTHTAHVESMALFERN